MNKKVCKCRNDKFDLDHSTGDYICTECEEVYDSLDNLPKIKYYEELEIDSKTVEYLQSILDLNEVKYQAYIKENGIYEDTVFFEKTIVFENEYKIILRMCTFLKKAYLNCILVQPDGCESPCYLREEILGEVYFEDDEEINFVLIKEIA